MGIRPLGIVLALASPFAALAGCGGSTTVVTVTQTTAASPEQTQPTPTTTTETVTLAVRGLRLADDGDVELAAGPHRHCWGASQ